MKSLNFLVDATLSIEKLRVATEVRRSHLKLNGKSDPETDELHTDLVALEKKVDKKIATMLKSHPAYNWFSKVKGIGLENVAKIIGLVRLEPEYDDDGKELPYADTISSLWEFAGYGVIDGKAPKRVSGEKLGYNSQLRSMCWRVGGSLMKANGKFYKYYIEQKERYYRTYEAQGRKVVPATQLPKIGGKKQENEQFISEGHVHNQALRKMIKLFLACLFLEWRKGLGLPETTPYAIGVLKHDSFISPASMTDK